MYFSTKISYDLYLLINLAMNNIVFSHRVVLNPKTVIPEVVIGTQD